MWSPTIRAAILAERSWLDVHSALQVDSDMKRPRPTVSQRRALAILADSGLNGSMVDGLLAAGFKLVTIARLVRNGLASATAERMKASEQAIKVCDCGSSRRGREAIAAQLRGHPAV